MSDYDSRTMYACAVDHSGNLAVSYWHPNGYFRDYAEVVIYPPGLDQGPSYGPPTGSFRSYFQC
ncbi:MAG TPA: hypothetical protein VN936_12030 [Candidatus Acidoferrum sp.]|nr:hypothetical protein [Candidatus Acidoferrum sp.]